MSHSGNSASPLPERASAVSRLLPDESHLYQRLEDAAKHLITCLGKPANQDALAAALAVFGATARATGMQLNIMDRATALVPADAPLGRYARDVLGLAWCHEATIQERLKPRPVDEDWPIPPLRLTAENALTVRRHIHGAVTQLLAELKPEGMKDKQADAKTDAPKKKKRKVSLAKQDRVDQFWKFYRANRTFKKATQLAEEFVSTNELTIKPASLLRDCRELGKHVKD